MCKKLNLMIIAGEVSGDIHGAKLVKAIEERLPEVAFFGIGGRGMRAAGVEILHDAGDMAVMGLTEVFRKLGFFRRIYRDMISVARDRRPDAVILIDYPGFNLRFAAGTSRLGLKNIYYICPQVWAWNRSRIPGMARILDRLITIFPFEREYFEGTGLVVDFAGHPLVDEAEKTWNEPSPELPWQGQPRVAVLPGSRYHEIDRILPVMWQAAGIVKKKHAGASFIVATPSPEVEDIVRRKLTTLTDCRSRRPEVRTDGPVYWSIVTGNTRHVLRQARAALIASGTATMEAAVMLCPMVIAYRMASLTYHLARMFVSVKHIGMVNIAAGRGLCPEFIQGKATAGALADSIEPLLTETPERSRMIQGLEKVKQSLGTGGAGKRAADIIIRELSGPVRR